MELDKKYYLGFLDELMACTGTTKADLARSLNTSWQNIQEKFNKGDMKVSKAEQLVESMGYTVKFVLDDGVHRLDGGSMESSMGGLLLRINDLAPEAARLEPLKMFLRLHGKSLKQTAEDIGVTVPTLQKYFREDDIYISRLYLIAEAYGWSVQAQLDRKA